MDKNNTMNVGSVLLGPDQVPISRTDNAVADHYGNKAFKDYNNAAFSSAAGVLSGMGGLVDPNPISKTLLLALMLANGGYAVNSFNEGMDASGKHDMWNNTDLGRGTVADLVANATRRGQ